jgi:hypothetical protein
MWRVWAVSLLLVAVGFSRPAQSAPYPDDSGIINVRAYGALGNGRSDDTAAILRAIAASGEDTGKSFWHDRIVYLPHGTYLVSGTLLKRYSSGQFGSGLQLAGESQANTTIRLIDHAPGFDDVRRPRPIIFTSSKLIGTSPNAGGKDYVGKGEGNDAYMNFVEDLTIDVGEDNPGAVGIDFLGNNLDGIRNVTIRAPDGSGATGLSMTRKWPGPTLVQNLTIQGFNRGIETAQTEYGLTFDHIRLVGQKISAIHNNQNALAMRDVEITGVGPLITNDGEKGFIAIDHGMLTASSKSEGVGSLIASSGIVRLKDVKAEIHDGGRRQDIGSMSGILQGPTAWKPLHEESWVPQGADSPAPPNIAPNYWANAARYGAVSDIHQDSTEGLRRAFASGAPVIYLPQGTYAISDTIEIPASVRRIVGMNSTIQVLQEKRAAFPNSKPMFRVSDAGAPLMIERLHFDHSFQGLKVAVELAGRRDVTIRDAIGAGVVLLDRKYDGGRAFLENTCCGKLQTTGPAPVFAKQLNTEGGGSGRISNVGSPLWILGLKTEGVTTVIDNRAGARTNVFGGLIYMVRNGADRSVPAFRNTDSWLAASIVEESLRPNSRYSVYVAQESSGRKRDIVPSDFPARGYGRFIPGLMVSPDQLTSQ